MKYIKFLVFTFSLLVFPLNTSAQKTEIAIGLSEHFFETIVDALFQAGGPPEFAIASIGKTEIETRAEQGESSFVDAAFNGSAKRRSDTRCKESIRLQRETAGTRTAVRFRDGKITAPLAFNGSYNPPFIGCVDFSGWADSVIDLEFDQANQRLIAKARVLNVNLNGTGGIGGSVIAKMVQTAIDRKVNPIELLKLDKVSFMLPIQNSANLQMRAVGIRHEIRENVLVVQIAYEFSKAG